MFKKPIASFVLILCTFIICMLSGCVQNEADNSGGEASTSNPVTAENSPAAAENQTEESQLSISEYVDAMSPGWNLGNSLDATGGETSWGNPAITKDLISAIKESGYNSIRVPITWNKYIDDKYNIDNTYMSRVKEVVDWCIEEGFYVMINIHHDSWNWVNTYDKDKTVIDKFAYVWAQISEEFKDYSTKLMFESINEPYFDSGDEQAMLDEMNIKFFETVRNSGGNNENRPLVLPSLYTSAETKNCGDLMSTIERLNDPNIIATVHYYAPWSFSVNIAGSYKFDDSVAKDIKTAFDICYDELVSKGVPVVVGEYGVLGTVEAGEYYKYINCLYEVTRGRGITLMKWDNGSVYDRHNYKWRDEYEQALTIACTTSSCSYTEQDTLFVSDDPEDITQQLILNGNTLTEVKCGDALLTSESDYYFTDNSITFKSDFLKQFVKDDYEEKAVLTLSFSGGADWHITVYHCTAPEYGTLTAKRQNMRIPVKFNGNIVTTLEAVDPESGNGVGPHNWTTYKEYDYAFVVNYNSGFITLTQAFRDEFSDDSVLFKIHYADGRIDEYLMEITDGIISGTPLSGDASFDITDGNLDSGSLEEPAAETETGGNKLLASLDVSSLNADSFVTEAAFLLNDGEEPGICLRVNNSDDQYYYLGSGDYYGWFQTYPHLGAVLVESSDTYEGERVDYGSISSLSVETWGKGILESMTVYLYAGDELVGTAEYSAETSQIILKYRRL